MASPLPNAHASAGHRCVAITIAVTVHHNCCYSCCNHHCCHCCCHCHLSLWQMSSPSPMPYVVITICFHCLLLTLEKTHNNKIFWHILQQFDRGIFIFVVSVGHDIRAGSGNKNHNDHLCWMVTSCQKKLTSIISAGDFTEQLKENWCLWCLMAMIAEQ